nr:VOC family protein [Paenibacillus sp. Marseille-Q4541]
MGTDPVDVQGLLELADNKPFTGLPAGTIIGHVHFHISDLEEARQFYHHLLGFDVVLDDSRYFRALFVSAGGYHHHIGLNIWAGQGAPKVPSDAVGIDYFTIIFENQAVYEEALIRLEQNGIMVLREANEAKLTDPFGIQIRITHA